MKFVDVTSCDDCPVAYVRLDDTAGCHFKRGIRIHENQFEETFHDECPLVEGEITVRAKYN